MSQRSSRSEASTVSDLTQDGRAKVPEEVATLRASQPPCWEQQKRGGVGVHSLQRLNLTQGESGCGG
jgi:hypothetical protein